MYLLKDAARLSLLEFKTPARVTAYLRAMRRFGLQAEHRDDIIRKALVEVQAARKLIVIQSFDLAA